MTPDQARKKLEHLAQERARLADAEPAAIIDAIDAGLRQADIARAINRTREHVRRIARENGIESTR